MQRKRGRVLIPIVVTLLVILMVAFIAIDGIAASFIDRSATKALGVETRVGSVNIGIFTDHSSLTDLRIANPKGYTAKNILSMKNVEAEASAWTLMSSGQLEISSVTIRGIELELEQTGSMSNVEEIINHAEKIESKGATVNIGTLRVEDVTVVARGKFSVVQTGTVTAKIKELVLHDVGSASHGERVVQAVTAAVTQAIMKHLSENPVEGFSQATIGQVLGLIDGLPVIGELGIGRGLQDGVSGISKGVDDIVGGVENLLGGGKKK